jgi:inner membrane protein
MDSLTHIAIGACIGEAFFEKGFGKKAMFWGALAQSIPDIDFIASFWLDTTDNLLAHRGFTHSFLFALMIVPVFAFTANRVHKPHNIRFQKWLLFFAVEVFVHLLLDVFNNYGIGWLEPFSNARFSLNTIFVADPLFSIWPGIAFIALLVLNSKNNKRNAWWIFGLLMPLLYIGYCSFNKASINRDVKKILSQGHTPYKRFFTSPAPFQNWLWYVVSERDSGFDVGFRSVFDRNDKIDFQYFPRNESLLAGLDKKKDIDKLIRFSQHYFTIEKREDTLQFNDLRFGQIMGWENPKGDFVFHYYISPPIDNTMVVQRGRFTGWNKQSLLSYWKRIRGN